jgi:Putative zinc-finger
VQREDDRDRAIDRALRQAMAPSGALDSARAESRGHLDGETLAAWAEGQLRPEAAARVEEHVSNCAQCQQMLAAFARTAPPPLVSEPIWRRWHLQWLVPIATAATVAAIWVAIPRDEQERATSPLVARVTEAPQTPAAAEPVAPSQSQNAAAPPSPQPAKEFKQSRSVAIGQSAASAAKPAEAASSAKREEFERRDAQGQLADRFAEAPPQAAQRAPVPQEGAREKDDDKKLQGLQETIVTAPGAAAPVPPAAGATASAARTETAADTRLRAARALAAPAEIRAPNSTNRWRIVGGGRQIERTTSGGTQWEMASLSAPAVLTAGVSPAPSICWIVGRAGAVYLTTDGLRFSRVMFPESIDLVSVAATDDRHATVMSADGRSFRTDDGGMTWTR